jgi:Xaa-Pro dipeptidase
MTYDIQHDTLSLFIPRINEKRVIWNGRGSTLAEALVKYDVDEVYYSDEVSDYITDWYHRSCNAGSLYILHDAQSSKRPFGRLNGLVDATSLQPAMNVARMIKDEHEVMLIKKANDISSKAHREVLANILSFKNEAQVEGLFLDVCVSQQAKQQAYDPIAASGPNAGTLHYDANNEDFEDRQLMCLDAGCEYELYASDITRTFPLSSRWPSKEAANIYKLVERMQESCIKRLAPGVRYLDLHILAHQIAIDGLLALGVLHNGTKEEIYKAGTSRAFFPHGLGHHVGLEVHDVGQADLMSIRRGKQIFDQTPSLYPVNFHIPVYDPKTCHAPADPQSSHLEEGMVVTIEPGIYFSIYALQRFYLPSPIHSKYINVEVLQRYLPVGGVRIEDDLLITPKGYENLTTAPKGDAMLDIIRKGHSSELLFPPRRQFVRSNTSREQPELVRAPGISTDQPESILKPIARAATMPAEFKQRKSVDFEPCDGPSLFSNFKRSLTTDERIQQWQQDRDLAVTSKNQSHARSQCASVCGEMSKGVKHVYLVSEFHRQATPYSSPFENPLPPCKKCTILCETLDRLRHNLSLSEQSSPKPEAQSQFMATNQKQYMEDIRDKSVPPGLCTQQSSRDLKSPQRQERSAKLNVTRDVQRSPQSTSRHGETVPMACLVLDSRQASLRKRQSVPGLDLQEFEGHLPRHISEQAGQSQKTARARASERFAYLSSAGKPRLEDKFREAKGAALMERLHQEAEQASKSARESRPSADQTTFAKQTLYDLMVQRQMDPSLGGERCQLGMEQGNQQPSSGAPKKTQAETTKRLPERRDHIRGHLEDLDAQLTTYMRSFRVTDPPSQQETARRAEE